MKLHIEIMVHQATLSGVIISRNFLSHKLATTVCCISLSLDKQCEN